MKTAHEGSVVARLARFVVTRSWDDLAPAARDELKIREVRLARVSLAD
jgi:hypothetical protein